MSTLDETAKMGTSAQKRNSNKLLLLVIIVLVAAILLLLAAILWLSLTKGDKSNTTETFVEQVAAQDVDFPLYYPKQLPKGFSIDTNSVAAQETKVMSFSISSPDGGKLLVTEQPRPPIMEEVQKSVDFKTPHGDAYIANLNGRIAGFIRTQKTLIILSVVGKVSTDHLRQVMNQMTPL